MPRVALLLLDRLTEAGRTARRWWFDVAVAFCLIYFAYHLVQGQRGLLAWIDRQREVEVARHELGKIEAERVRLQARIDQLRPGSASRDAIEEELRKLGYVDPREAIILPEASP